MGEPVVSLVVMAGAPGVGLRRSLAAMRAASAPHPVQLIVASPSPWPDAPEDVTVVTAPGASRGDLLDRAAELARGRCIAFLDRRIRLNDGWIDRVLAHFEDPVVGIVGGPVRPRSTCATQRVTAALLQSRIARRLADHIAWHGSSRTVSEVPASNLVIPRTLFRAVGGFQSPSPGGESTRLCFKVRTLLDLNVVVDPALTAAASPPRFPGELLRQVTAHGRVRGDMGRRLGDMSPAAAHALPLLALAALVPLGVLLAHLPRVRLFSIALFAAAYAFTALEVLLHRAQSLRARLVAAAALPALPVAYAIGFARGFAGPSLSEVSPRRRRQRPPRVLIFNWRDVAHPWAGGAEAYMHEIGRRWVRAGWEVGWIAQRHPSTRRVETIDGIRIHRAGGPMTGYALATLAYLVRLRRRYDVIVDCENGIPFFTPLFTRKPVVLVVHHVHQEVFRTQLPKTLRPLALWLEGWLVPRVYRRTQVLAVSQSTRSDLVALGFDASRITVVRNGVQPPQSLPEVQRDPATLLYLGRLKPYKGVEVLIRALPAVLRHHPEAALHIVGQGPDRPRLERVAWSLGLADRVRFHGYLSNAERDRLAARATIALAPSAFEGYGVTCVEAGGRGMPVIASRVQGLRDSVIDGVTGVLVPHGDAHAMAAAVVRLLDDPHTCRSMGEAGRAWAREHDWDHSARDFAAVLSRLLPDAWIPRDTPAEIEVQGHVPHTVEDLQPVGDAA